MSEMNDLLTRISVAREIGWASPELLDDVESALCVALPIIERRELQAGYIRKAADCLTGTPWQKAEQLATIIRRWTGRNSDEPIRALLYQASQTGLRLPASTRHLYRVITDS